MPGYKLLLAILILGFMFAQKSAAQTTPSSNLERYDYQYIVELFSRGETEKVLNEINSFQARYPQSYYSHHLRFIGANLVLEKDNYTEALRVYDELLREDLELSLRHQVYLYRAICLIGMGETGQAMDQIQILESETKDTFLLARANLYRARLYKSFGQYYSAKESYEYTLREHPEPEIEYEYLEVLVKLSKDDDARALLNKIHPENHIYRKSNVLWAKYLLDNNRFVEFDEHMSRIQDIWAHPSIELLRMRKAFALDNYEEATAILSNSENSGEYYDYYNAILLIHQGQPDAADEILAGLVQEASAEIKVLSYLERIKIMYQDEPIAAMVQLANFIEQPQNTILKAEQLYTMGYFAYLKEDYQEGLRFLAQARRESNNRLLLADIDLLIGLSWLRLKDNYAAQASFNKYLNQYPDAKDRDTAWYYLGYLYHEAKNYGMATTAFSKVISEHANSSHVPSAKFYLAEIDYYLANYNRALDAFLAILKHEKDNQDAILRVAQIYYYLGDYDNARPWLKKLLPSYDSLILEGHISFIEKDYERALDAFQKAELSSDNSLKISEAKSYRALCLYQMKRYNEASVLYMELFRGPQSPDTYLYLGAKSAYSAGDYHLALQLFDQFLLTYPDSQYYLSVLADVANSYFNMGNYEQAIADYANILRRYRNVAEFTTVDQALLREVFTGLEVSLVRHDDLQAISELAAMIDTFKSQYMKFELSYLLTKLYAEKKQWNDVLAQAEDLRYSFPDYKRSEVEMLMAESLVNLNEYNRADSLLSTLYSDTLDLETLVAWAEVDVLLGNYEDAILKLSDALNMKPSAEVWHKALRASVESDYLQFEDIWAMGEQFLEEVPPARILQMQYLEAQERYEEANAKADTIINESLSAYDHARAFLYKALILHKQNEFEAAIDELDKLIMLFPDFPDVLDDAVYYMVLSYLKSGAKEEAQMHLWDYSPHLSEEHLTELNSLLQEEAE
jgi:tetratricopeptide (TPR) repeat protein